MPIPAVLFIIFNRPHETGAVFRAIRTARPLRLYIAADGPRDGRKGEAELCAEARRIATDIDWPCEVQTKFRERNLGCRHGPATAIDWFFENEEEGIILEDDCVPSASFFPYCAELLEHYRDDPRIMCISGDNPRTSTDALPTSYVFSHYPLIWGWATWRRAWQLYDANLSNWPAFRDSGRLRLIADHEAFEKYWSEIFDRTSGQLVDYWDYQWTFSCWLHGGLTCVPSINLVSNIGFGPDATHTFDVTDSRARLQTNELDFPLVHPEFVRCDVGADLSLCEALFGAALRRVNWLERVRRRVGLRTRLRSALAHFTR